MPIRNEIVLPHRVVRQPTPSLHSGGDCGACVLGGLLGMTPTEIYPYFDYDPTKEDISYERMRRALWDTTKFDRKVLHHPEWRQPVELMRTYGSPSWAQSMEWFEYVTMALEAGYYGIANVDHTKQGGSPDHWVLLVGTHEVYPEASGPIDQRVLVSCSSRSTPDEEWVEVHDFLKQRGGFNLFLARPRATAALRTSSRTQLHPSQAST